VQEPLTILGVLRIFEDIAAAKGAGSRRRKQAILANLLARLTEHETEYLMRLIFGEMRIGVVEGVMLDAIAERWGIDPVLVRRAHMLIGSLGEVAALASSGGEAALRAVGVRLFTPIRPMLAEMSYDIGEVLTEHGGRTAFEHKYDGVRVQIHRQDAVVRIFSRRLTDVTSSVPDIVRLVRSDVSGREFLVEGEIVAVGEKGKPLPFQDLMRRLRRRHEVRRMMKEVPLRLLLFDVIYHDGTTLIDETYETRWGVLAKMAPLGLLSNQLVTGDVSEAERFMVEALKAGHEGLMAKSLVSRYTPGVRGKYWFKIKPAEFLDVAIIAAEWGSGRRKGWLSNYHLAVRDEEAGEFLMIGKTFKGLTDEEFEEMTKRLQALRVREGEWTVFVKPSVVVQVAYNEIQKSPHYNSGFALRFARITAIREDKGAEDVDTITTLRKLYERQFTHKDKPMVASTRHHG
jgi:DNA ligase-1